MYSDHYGLSGNPFQLTPDPRFWFESDTHRKAMAYLGYGLAQGEGFIVITGDIGAGKTTLVGHLMDTLDTSRVRAVNIVSTQVDGDDMLRLVAQRLGMNVSGLVKAELLDRIERALHDEARAGRRTLIIVDEAQNLGTSALEELRMLSNFQANGRALVQIFLLGQPEFRDRVKHSPDLEQMRQRVIATHHLDPMQADEIGGYVGHRLEQVGWQGNPAFTDDAFHALYEATDGVPRRVNTLMARVLLFGAVDNVATIDGDVVGSVLADLAQDEDAGEAPASDQPSRAAAIFAPEVGPEPETSDWFEPVEAEQAELEPLKPAPDTARLDAIEARLDEQEAALRRVLTLLVEWVEEEESRPSLGVVGGSAA